MADLKINNFQKKVNLTYLQEFSKLKNIDADTVSGVAMVNYALKDDVSSVNGLESYTFTANAGNDTLTTSGIYEYSGATAVTLTTTGVLPAGLSTSTTYYVITENTNTLKLASSLSNILTATQIDIIDAGTGTHTIVPTALGGITSIVDNNGTGTFNIFAVDSNGVIWTKYNDTWTVISGNSNITVFNLVIWKDYLFAIGTSGVDVYGTLSDISTAAWKVNFTTFSDVTGDRPVNAGLNETRRLYIGVSNQIVTIEETAGDTFDPNDGASYDVNSTAFDVPSGYKITTLAELGSYLAIGTQYGTGDGAGTIADIFFWNGQDDQADTVIQLGTRGVKSMINYGGVIYAMAGTKGEIYALDSTSSKRVGMINAQMLGLQQDSMQFNTYSNAIGKYRDKILFGGITSQNGDPVGVFSFNPQTGGTSLEFTVSTGSDGSGGTLTNIYCLYVKSDEDIFVGYTDDTVNKIDRLSTSRRYTKDSYIETGLYRVGQDRRKAVYKHTEIVLAKDLETANSVIVSYRTKLNENFTEIGRITEGYQKIIDKDINVDSIQIKIELKTNSQTGHSPELISVNLY